MATEVISREVDKPLQNLSAGAKRVKYIDIAKGIGIVLVVMGHNDFSLISSFAFKLIYSFHMPMFFFMSGMFFKPDMPFWKFASRRFNRVLRPFLFTILLIYFMRIFFSKVSIIVATRNLLKALYANGHYLNWVQLWFLPHLFAVSLFAYFFVQMVRRAKLSQWRLVILLLIYTLGVLGITFFWPFEFTVFGKTFIAYGLPMSLDLVFVSGLFFILGYELNNKLHQSLFDNVFILLISAISLVALVWFFSPTIDFNIRLFESPLINTGEALLGIIFILALSKQLERIKWLSALFRYIGQASLIILVFQVPIQDYSGQKIFALTNNLPFSYWASFLLGVLVPIVIRALFILPNPILREWFSQPAPQRNGKISTSVYE
jgi:polysaccharide biosynthesis protein PslL